MDRLEGMNPVKLYTSFCVYICTHIFFFRGKSLGHFLRFSRNAAKLQMVWSHNSNTNINNKKTHRCLPSAKESLFEEYKL